MERKEYFLCTDHLSYTKKETGHWSNRPMQMRYVVLDTALTDILSTSFQSLTVLPETQPGLKSHIVAFLLCGFEQQLNDYES